MSYSEALRSSYLESVKVARAAVKGSIMKALKRLEAILVSTPGGGAEFDHDSVNKIEARDLYNKLQKSSVIFQELHD